MIRYGCRLYFACVVSRGTMKVNIIEHGFYHWLNSVFYVMERGALLCFCVYGGGSGCFYT